MRRGTEYNYQNISRSRPDPANTDTEDKALRQHRSEDTCRDMRSAHAGSVKALVEVQVALCRG
jgi:hypothetical protein